MGRKESNQTKYLHQLRQMGGRMDDAKIISLSKREILVLDHVCPFIRLTNIASLPLSQQWETSASFEPWHEISNNVALRRACAAFF